MSRLIDAISTSAMTATCPKGMDLDSYIAGMGVVLDRIAEAPTVDAVEVVRCKDCKYFYYNSDSIGACSRNSTQWGRFAVDGDWFCADGKRKEQNDG